MPWIRMPWIWGQSAHGIPVGSCVCVSIIESLRLGSFPWYLGLTEVIISFSYPHRFSRSSHHLCHLFSFRSSHFIIIIIIIGVVIIIVRYWHSSPSCLSLIIITIICVDFILPFKLLYSLSFKFLVIQVTTGWFSSHHSSCVYSHHESCFCPLSFVDFNSDISPDILWGNLTWQ